VRLVGTGISSGVPAATLPAEENPGYRGDGDDDWNTQNALSPITIAQFVWEQDCVLNVPAGVISKAVPSFGSGAIRCTVEVSVPAYQHPVPAGRGSGQLARSGWVQIGMSSQMVPSPLAPLSFVVP